jgi:hypothetical protein
MPPTSRHAPATAARTANSTAQFDRRRRHRNQFSATDAALALYETLCSRSGHAAPSCRPISRRYMRAGNRRRFSRRSEDAVTFYEKGPGISGERRPQLAHGAKFAGRLFQRGGRDRQRPPVEHAAKLRFCPCGDRHPAGVQRAGLPGMAAQLRSAVTTYSYRQQPAGVARKWPRWRPTFNGTLYRNANRRAHWSACSTTSGRLISSPPLRHSAKRTTSPATSITTFSLRNCYNENIPCITLFIDLYQRSLHEKQTQRLIHGSVQHRHFYGATLDFVFPHHTEAFS